MTCEISTGRKIINVNSKVQKIPTKALFDQTSTKLVSPFLHLLPCEALQLSTFNLPAGAELAVYRVLLTGGGMPQGSGCICDYEEGSPVSVAASEPFKIDCDPVVLTHCNNVLFLTTPGSYILRLNSEDYLGHFWAFAEVMDCCCLPDGLVIGNRKGNGYVGTRGA